MTRFTTKSEKEMQVPDLWNIYKNPKKQKRKKTFTEFVRSSKKPMTLSDRYKAYTKYLSRKKR